MCEVVLANAAPATSTPSSDDTSAQSTLKTHRQQLTRWIRGPYSLANLRCDHILQRNAHKWHEGTNKWFREDPAFAAWTASKKSGSSDNAICLTAAPGCGKTVLASKLARTLEDDGHKVVISYYDFNDKTKKSADSALRSLAIDLLNIVSYVPSDVLHMYQTDMSGEQYVIDNIVVVAQVITGLIRAFPRIHIILDGLDECKDRSSLFIALPLLIRAKSPGLVKWFLTSRSEHQIRSRLSSCGLRELKASHENIREDIINYLNHFISAYGVDPDNELPLLESGLGIDSNFVWASRLTYLLQHAIAKIAEPTDIVAAIRDIPKSMTGLYIRSLQRLAKLSPKKQALAEKLIAFVIGCEQSLKLSELSHALAATLKSQDFKQDKVPPYDTLKDLGMDLITFDTVDGGTEEDPIVKFPHLTIYEFLAEQSDLSKMPTTIQRFFITPEKASAQLGEACLQYLSYKRYAQLMIIADVLTSSEHVFLRYAATYWHHHLDVRSPSSDLHYRIQLFMSSLNFWTTVAVQSCITPYIFSRYEQTAAGYTPTVGNMLLPARASTVLWGVPLPSYIRTPESKRFTELIIQWHHVLNTYPDQVHQCRMGSAWEQRWPEYWGWASMQPGLRSMSSSMDDPENLELLDDLLPLTNARLCCVLRQVLGITTHIPRDPSTGLVQITFCERCAAAAPEAKLEGLVIEEDTHNAKIQTGEANKLLLAQAELASTPLTADWQLGAFSSNLTAVEEPRSTPSMVAQWYHQPKLKRVGTDRRTYKHTLLVCRQACQPLSHQWTSIHRTDSISPAFHPSKPWVIWSSEHGELSVVRDAMVEKVALPELVDHEPVVRSADGVHRDMHISKDGKHLWYAIFTSREGKFGLDHALLLSQFSLRLEREDLKLERVTTSTLTYSTFGKMQPPGIVISWRDEYVVMALAPVGSKPRILRYSLERSEPVFEALSLPLFFPATAPARNPQLEYLMRSGGADILVLLLAAEQPDLREDNAPACDAHIQPDDMSIDCQVRATDTVLQGPVHIAWHIHRTEDWREWQAELDSKSDEYRAASLAAWDLRGGYIDRDKPFKVATRSGLDWRRQAVLTCS